MIRGGKAISMCENFELRDLENTLLILRCIGSLNLHAKVLHEKRRETKISQSFLPAASQLLPSHPSRNEVQTSELLLDYNIKQA